MMMFGFVLPLVLGSGVADAAPAPGRELSKYRQAEAYRAAEASRETSAIAGVIGDQSLTEALAATLLEPEAAEGRFSATDAGYAYEVSVAWQPDGSIDGIVDRLESALGSASRGDVYCFGGAEDVEARLTVASNMSDAFLEQLGVSVDSIKPQDRILGQIGDDSVALNPQTMGPLLFAGVLSEVEDATRPVNVRLSLYAPKPLVVEDTDDLLRIKTKKNRVIEIPVEIIGDVAKLDAKAVESARWRIAGTTREIPLDLGYGVQRALLATVLKTGVARLSELRKEVIYPVARQRVALPSHEMHLLGDRNAWFGAEKVEGNATVMTRRGDGSCDVEVTFTARDAEVTVGPLPTNAWPRVKSFRLVNPDQLQARLAYLDPPAEGRDPGGVSNDDFDERLTRAGRCEQACGQLPALYSKQMEVARSAWLAEQKAQSKSGEVDESAYVAPTYRFAEKFQQNKCLQACNASKGYAGCVESVLRSPEDFLRQLDVCEAKSPLR